MFWIVRVNYGGSIAINCGDLDDVSNKWKERSNNQHVKYIHACLIIVSMAPPTGHQGVVPRPV